jgi:hypothetical protein
VRTGAECPSRLLWSVRRALCPIRAAWSCPRFGVGGMAAAAARQAAAAAPEEEFGQFLARPGELASVPVHGIAKVRRCRSAGVYGQTAPAATAPISGVPNEFMNDRP